MKTLILYGTLSGSTMTAAELVGSTLREAGHDTNVVSIESATNDLVTAHDALIIASPSWEDEGKDGQPLPEIRKFLESLTTADLTGKKVAVVGLGDIAYPHFCGAVDVLEAKLKELGVTPATASLRVDRYYSLPDNEQKVKNWSANFAKAVTT
ncbi:flavodoxin domain-containing protein [Patescibacteria group bacterium]|nr:flavodoxin domain-containing protein [Patescibacteria group bacterium]